MVYLKFRVGKMNQNRKVMVHTTKTQKVLEEGGEIGEGKAARRSDRLFRVISQRVDTLSACFFCLVCRVSLSEGSRPTPRHGEGLCLLKGCVSVTFV
jgi:hypothetical protein